MSISSTIYVRFFANILASKNFKPKTQLCNFWRQNIGAKCVHKMLMKLTPVWVSSVNKSWFTKSFDITPLAIG